MTKRTLYSWMYSWNRKHFDGYEVTTYGDKEYSAFNAILEDGRSIEQHYQCDVKGFDPGGKNWKLGKGKPPVNGKTDSQLWREYLDLWRRWVALDPMRLDELKRRMGDRHVLTDVFAYGPINQANALATLLNEREEEMAKLAVSVEIEKKKKTASRERVALQKLVSAWECLPGDKRYTKQQIEDWLVHDMKPAIDHARKVLR